MPASRLNVPQPLDIVAADQVNQIIADVDREIAELEREATRLTREADELEARLRNDGLDDASMTWTMVRLQLFLDQLRAQAQEESEATLDVARRRADAAGHRSGLARTFDADEAAGFAPLAPRRPPLRPIVDEPARAYEVTPPVLGPDATLTPDQPRAASDSHTLAWSAPMAAAPSPAAPTTDGAGLRVDPTPPSTNGHAPQSLVTAPAAVPTEASDPVVPPPAVTPAPPAALASSPAVSTASAVALDPAAAAPVAVDASPAAAPNPPIAAAAAPARESAATKKGFLRRLPISAVLEVVAVLLILVFILLRLS